MLTEDLTPEERAARAIPHASATEPHLTAEQKKARVQLAMERDEFLKGERLRYSQDFGAGDNFATTAAACQRAVRIDEPSLRAAIMMAYRDGFTAGFGRGVTFGQSHP